MLCVGLATPCPMRLRDRATRSGNRRVMVAQPLLPTPRFDGGLIAEGGKLDETALSVDGLEHGVSSWLVWGYCMTFELWCKGSADGVGATTGEGLERREQAGKLGLGDGALGRGEVHETAVGLTVHDDGDRGELVGRVDGHGHLALPHWLVWGDSSAPV